MTERRTFSDEELTSYLDGEAEASLTEAIDVARRQNAQIETRIAELDVDTATMKSAFDAVLDDAPTMPPELGEHGALSRSAPAWSLRALAATAVLCLMLGGLAGAWFATPREASWREFAAAYHALYVTRTLSVVETGRPGAEAELQRVSQALGKTIELAALSTVDKLDYKRAQVLGFEGRPLIQLAFLSKDGVPVALCITPATGAETSALEMQQMHAMSTASWSKDGFSYFLVGGSDDALIGKAAARFAERL